MQYIKLTNNIPKNYSISQLHEDNPQVSFPINITEKTLTEYNILPLTVLPKPSYNQLTHYLKASEIYQVNGKWQQHYYSEPFPIEQAASNVQTARRAAYTEEADPLFFKWQRGESTQEVWLDKVAEIKAKYTD